ncbi:hypothetical protein VNO80_18345 [Phaseolus coccineus]|uniref:Uncharacterized protein n=1 Tax=Phaseolus coccineus TaxID=3886 RepID=A0AAN9MHJ5_PHACN
MSARFTQQDVTTFLSVSVMLFIYVHKRSSQRQIPQTPISFTAIICCIFSHCSITALVPAHRSSAQQQSQQSTG